MGHCYGGLSKLLYHLTEPPPISSTSLVCLKTTIEKTDITEAIITRSEKVKTSTAAGNLTPIIRAGERVSAGEKVAVLKSEATKDIEKSIDELNAKVDKLVVPTVFPLSLTIILF